MPIPRQVDDFSGIGTQVRAGDVTGDGNPDVIVGNKQGTYLLQQIPSLICVAVLIARYKNNLSIIRFIISKAINAFTISSSVLL